MKGNILTVGLTKPSLWKVLAVVIAGAVLTALYFHAFGEPAQPWVVKWRIYRYLHAHGAHSNPKLDFKFPTKAEMAKVPADATAREALHLSVGPLTKKDFDVIKAQYVALQLECLAQEDRVAQIRSKAAPGDATASNAIVQFQKSLAEKQAALEPLVSDLWAFQRAWEKDRKADDETGTDALNVAWQNLSSQLRARMGEAGSYDTIYEAINEELVVADRLLPSANPDHRRVALRIIRQAVNDSLSQAENGWLAARICEAYVLPHVALAERSGGRNNPMSFETVLAECARVFSENEEPQNVVRAYAPMLAPPSTPATADRARQQIAQVYEQSGQYHLAVKFLKQIQATNDYRGVLRRIPRLEQMAKAQ